MTDKELYEYASSLLSYDNDTGQLTWKAKPCINIRVGTTAGNRRPDGYVRIKIAKKDYLAHRIIWLLVHGSFPEHQIDHINGNPSDNRLANLRDVVPSVNKQNTRVPAVNNKSGFLGVCWAVTGWQASIQLPKGRRVFLGKFQTKELAHAAYVAAKRVLHPGSTI